MTTTSGTVGTSYDAGTVGVTAGTEAVVTKVLQGGGGPAVEAIGSTNVSSIFWAMHSHAASGRGQWAFGFPGPVIVNALSQVAVSITELDGNGRPFLGNAAMQVLNVVPHDDGTVVVRFHVDWPHALRFRLNFVIVN